MVPFNSARRAESDETYLGSVGGTILKWILSLLPAILNVSSESPKSVKPVLTWGKRGEIVSGVRIGIVEALVMSILNRSAR